jgi:tetratricopeptide (TPR) repeat protein
VREALLGRLADANAFVREASVRALEPLLETDPARVDSAISQRLDDAVRGVRLAAAWALRAKLDPSSRAGKELSAELDFNADQPAGQMQKGAYALARNQPQEALAHYQKATEWDPYSAAIHREMAIVLSGMGRSAEAVEHLERACALEPRNADYRYLLALGYNEVGQTSRTIEALQATVKLDPRHARAWYNLGLAFNGQGRVQEGLEALDRAETGAPGDARIPYARATILAQLGRINEARQAANRALQIQPGYAPAQELLRSLR